MVKALRFLISTCIFAISLQITAEEKISEALQENINTAAQDNNYFAWNLYSLLRNKTKDNIIFSPISISSTFVVVYAGAAGTTASQMQKALHFSLDQSELQPAFHKLTQQLTSYNQDINNDFRLKLVNSIWVQTGFPLRPEFLQQLPVDYQDRIRMVDFALQPDSVRNEINRRVLERTYGRIVDIIPFGMISKSTRLMLVTGIYAKAKWQMPFNPSHTKPAPFFNKDKTITTPMMETLASFPYLKTESFSMVELPYTPARDSPLQLTMVVVLPDSKNGLDAVEKEFSIEGLNKWMSQMSQQRVRVTLPKFSFSEGLSIKELLEKLGMPVAFTPQADFSKMTSVQGLAIGDVVHKAFIEVDENGTEAAAATAVSMNLTSMPSQKIEEFRADHPFIFFMIEKSTGAILFVGRLINP